MWKALLSALLIALLLLPAGCVFDTRIPPSLMPDPSPLIKPRLTAFKDEDEFYRYLQDLREMGEASGMWWSGAGLAPETLIASADTEIPCDPGDEGCLQVEEVVVTGSRRSAPMQDSAISLSAFSGDIADMSITNVQEAGVDEGDIIKLIGRYLVVLQDGRLFSIDLGAEEGELIYLDRINIYRSTESQIWYDELLVVGNHLVVLGFDYENSQSEIATFSINPDGTFQRRAAYYVQSNDYFTWDNYASRMVDGRLVFYTSMPLYEFDEDEKVAMPHVRLWEPDDGYSEWQPLFQPEELYWPLQITVSPVAHVVSNCSINSEDGVSCRSAGIVGSEYLEFYVSSEHFYLWLGNDWWDWSDWDCDMADTNAPYPSMLYRVAHADSSVQAVRTYGMPHNQFALDARDSTFHALVAWDPDECQEADDTLMRFGSIEMREFSRRPRLASVYDYVSVPGVAGYDVHARYGEEHLVYTYASGWWSRKDAVSAATIVPIESPERARRWPLPHTGDRLEVLGQHMISVGTAEGDLLKLTMVDLHKETLGMTLTYANYRESEGRSHAFNSMVRNGEGILGLPTYDIVEARARWAARDWRSVPSDITFATVSNGLELSAAGQLNPLQQETAAGYECEVSCVDWYGNARAVFIGNRVFGLSGTELMEGKLADGVIQDVHRIDLTQPAVNSRHD